MPSPSVPVGADPAHWFTESELAWSAAYHGALARLRAARLWADAAVPGLFLAAGLAARIAGPGGSGIDADRAVAVFVALEIAATPHRVLLGGWEELVHGRHGKGSDTASSLGRLLAGAGALALVRIALGAIALVVMLAVVEATEAWPLVLWGVSVGTAALVGALYPLVVAPVVDRTVPLDDASGRSRVRALAQRVGIADPVVFVATGTADVGEGAYVAGWGRTRRLVISAELLERSPGDLDAVVAHELGHWQGRHHRSALVAWAAMVGALLVTVWAIGEWTVGAGWVSPAEGVAAPELVPLWIVVAVLGGEVGRWLLASLSRQHERDADRFAVRLLGSGVEPVEHLRRHVVDHGADLDPVSWRRLRASHPAPAERLAAMAAGAPS